MEPTDYYKILDLDQNTTSQEIREAYRRLALEYHPDRNRDNPKAAERMKAINEAYAVLSNEQRRKEYDFLRQQYGPTAPGHFRRAYSEEDIIRDSDIEQIFEEISKMFGFRNFDDLRRESSGRAFTYTQNQRPGFYSKRVIFSFPFARDRKYTPPPLTGSPGRFTRFIIKKIAGYDMPEKGRDIYDTIRLDIHKARHGTEYYYNHLKSKKKLLVRIPPGVADGRILRLKGMGEQGKGGGDPGDLFLKVRIRNPISRKFEGLFSRFRQIWENMIRTR